MASITIRDIDKRLKTRLRVRAAHSGKPISQFDAVIVAMARSRGASLGTRNVKDFEDCGVDVVNPWTA
jgi:predicted nucleic acid-binding protein